MSSGQAGGKCKMKLSLSQSINTKAMLTLVTSVLRRPNLIVPHVSVPTISNVDFSSLRHSCGIRAVIFDKDNTLTGPYQFNVHTKAAWGLEEAKRVFGNQNVAVLSNSAGTVGEDLNMKEALQTESALGIPVIRHKEKKPGGRVLEEVMSHFVATNSSEPILYPWQLCMIGDRLLTDVVFGNLHGMLTVHCLPLCSGEDNVGDNAMAKIIRNVENKVLYGNSMVGRLLRQNTLQHHVWPGEMICPLVLESDDLNSS